MLLLSHTGMHSSSRNAQDIMRDLFVAPVSFLGSKQFLYILHHRLSHKQAMEGAISLEEAYT